MTLLLNICPQRGKSDDGDDQVWAEVYAEPTPKLRHRIPATEEIIDAMMPRLETLVEQVYEAGRLAGQEEIRRGIRTLLRVEKCR